MGVVLARVRAACSVAAAVGAGETDGRGGAPLRPSDLLVHLPQRLLLAVLRLRHPLDEAREPVGRLHPRVCVQRRRVLLARNHLRDPQVGPADELRPVRTGADPD